MTNAMLSDVTPATLPLLENALSQLSADLGDPHRVCADTLHRALFGPVPACHAVVATEKDGTLLGAALYSPVLSTSVGAAGVYVSDLWVAKAARGQALGSRLLSHVAERADDIWQVCFMRLASYNSNQRAGAFYARLGFERKTEETVLQINGDAFEQLRG